ncbi:restriction endonuclease subunit S [Vibrio parahaemolyticus]|uniref:restriction endonuclease subunit S n=1 Tax=Vibrio parahaemolyticus TaxID=670 RepID=UPI001B82DECB|nr:restriction endonuclease subunit S [Vibrio parahaemolyticus]MCC3831439.1 restriction endonuclease subunit S [Vibrio parahaemolyticus]HBC3510928.1 restriction endonuclease subunit S [Vibrio parahaemolyticus]HBH7855862.1 restriction endonuclease subunit S [Vibrio parahaemolyticus]
MSFEKKPITEIVDFNPKRAIKKGSVAPFIDMAALPVSSRDVDEITEKEFKSGGAKFCNGDTLFARITPCLENGKTAKVSGLDKNQNGFGSTEFIVMSAKDQEHDEDYVYYLARLPEFRAYAKARMEGTSGRQRVPWQSLAEFEYPLPSKEQRKLAGNFFRAIDDKISLNTQTNQTLEQMAQAIFKSWFVDFDPVKAKINGEQPEGMDAATASLFPEKLVESELGLIPEGWDVGTLSDVAKYCSARTKTDTITLENYISTENMLAEKKGVTAASKLPTAKTVAAYKSGDILVSNIRPYFKKIWLAEGSGGRSNDVLGFESVSANTESYLMNVLYQDTFFEYMTRTSKGAKMPRGDKTAIMNWEMAVPPVELCEAFSAIVDKFYQLIPQNRAQNATLEWLRDTLLPKLLSGELSLTDSLEVTNV